MARMLRLDVDVRIEKKTKKNYYIWKNELLFICLEEIDCLYVLIFYGFW